MEQGLPGAHPRGWVVAMMVSALLAAGIGIAATPGDHGLPCGKTGIIINASPRPGAAMMVTVADWLLHVTTAAERDGCSAGFRGGFP